MVLKSLVQVFIILTFTFGCSRKHNPIDSYGIPAGDAKLPVFDDDIKPIFAVRCISCHGNTWTDYDTVINSTNIKALLTARTMPKDAPLSPKNQALVDKWFEIDMPKTKEDLARGGPPPKAKPADCSEDVPTFDVVKKIFKLNCMSCHGNNPNTFDDWDKIENFADPDVRKDLAYLVNMETAKDSTNRNRMPKNSNPLEQNQLLCINKWLQGGKDLPAPPVNNELNCDNHVPKFGEIKDIFSKKCMSCHGNNTSTFDDWDNIANFADPENRKDLAYLINMPTKKDHNDRFRMPKNKNPLKPNQLKCINSWLNEGEDLPAPTNLLNCDDTIPTFDNEIKGIFEKRCSTSCHNDVWHNYDSLRRISTQNRLTHILSDDVDPDRRMPKGSELSSNQLKCVLKWFQYKAPKTKRDVTNPGSSDPKVTPHDIQKLKDGKVFAEGRCKYCHEIGYNSDIQGYDTATLFGLNFEYLKSQIEHFVNYLAFPNARPHQKREDIIMEKSMNDHALILHERNKIDSTAFYYNSLNPCSDENIRKLPVEANFPRLTSTMDPELYRLRYKKVGGDIDNGDKLAHKYGCTRCHLPNSNKYAPSLDHQNSFYLLQEITFFQTGERIHLDPTNPHYNELSMNVHAKKLIVSGDPTKSEQNIKDIAAYFNSRIFCNKGTISR